MSDDVEYIPPVTVKAGQIQFVDACHPPLVAGAYNVSMRQVIKESKDAAVPWNSDPYGSGVQFFVDAPRFTLNPADIHAVYPPSNQTGRFDNALPHVVFNRRTLPWERTLDGRAPKLGRPFPPWMGLLLVQEDELLILDEKGQTTNRKHEIRSLPIVAGEGRQDSLLFPTATNILSPELGQDGTKKWEMAPGQYAKESCLAIDLPGEFFKAIAPRLEDLPYLAHVRQIDTGDKEVQAINDRGWFSLVMGNRLAQADKNQSHPTTQTKTTADHRVFLVSLEGHQNRLLETWRPQPGQMVRLAVLGTWSFKCEGANDFKAHMDQLNVDSLHLPFASYDDSSMEPEDIVKGAYARGYTAFNHLMRQGEKTVSWYRGPLVPLDYVKPQQIEEPVQCTDELLRYDPDTGLFDVTYAAAWQLGRLLALQNHSFALALNRVRRALRAEAERQMRLVEIKDLKNGDDSIEESLMDRLAKNDGNSLTDAIPK
jgi:hypothetical protein